MGERVMTRAGAARPRGLHGERSSSALTIALLFGADLPDAALRLVNCGAARSAGPVRRAPSATRALSPLSLDRRSIPDWQHAGVARRSSPAGPGASLLIGATASHPMATVRGPCWGSLPAARRGHLSAGPRCTPPSGASACRLAVASCRRRGVTTIPGQLIAVVPSRAGRPAHAGMGDPHVAGGDRRRDSIGRVAGSRHHQGDPASRAGCCAFTPPTGALQVVRAALLTPGARRCAMRWVRGVMANGGRRTGWPWRTAPAQRAAGETGLPRARGVRVSR